MKNKNNFSKKLSLHKRTVSSLNPLEMVSIHGGDTGNTKSTTMYCDSINPDDSNIHSCITWESMVDKLCF